MFYLEFQHEQFCRIEKPAIKNNLIKMINRTNCAILFLLMALTAENKSLKIKEPLYEARINPLLFLYFL